MLAVFDSGAEILICQVNSAGEPVTGDYFTGKNGDQRDEDDYDLSLVEAPIMITPGCLRVEWERDLAKT